MQSPVLKKEIDLFGEGSRDANLGRVAMREIISRALEAVPEGSRIVAIVPDKTRDDTTHVLLPMAIDELTGKKLTSFEVLIAQGTHAPMTDAEKYAKTGREAWATWTRESEIHDHRWNNPGELIELGELGAETVSELTVGIYSNGVKVSVNRRLSPANCDIILIFGAVLPHEVAGFAGGAKYLFPGVSGRELTNVTHWIGALSGIENVIGRVDTPVRRMIEAAADMIPARVICFSSVVSRVNDGTIKTRALFAGDLRKTFRAAAEISREVHIRRTGRKYQRVVAILDHHFDELWTGGKASYKLGGIIEDGGELIIYAPHLTHFSRTHGKKIERFGYAPIERIRELAASERELADDLCVAAHLAHVAYAGRENGNGTVEPRFRITLSSQISKERCEKANLGYTDPAKIDIDRLQNDPETLVVQRAGRDLYIV
jgi:nickel-dependent lactate racemase